MYRFNNNDPGPSGRTLVHKPANLAMSDHRKHAVIHDAAGDRHHLVSPFVLAIY